MMMNQPWPSIARRYKFLLFLRLTPNTFRGLNGASLLRRTLIKNNIRTTAEHLGSASDPTKQNGKPLYLPFEEIGEATSKISDDAILTAAESSRTIIEVNNKATLMFTGMINDEVHENIIWPDLPYATDEQGNIYIQVKSDEDILQSLTVENNFVVYRKLILELRKSRMKTLILISKMKIRMMMMVLKKIKKRNGLLLLKMKMISMTLMRHLETGKNWRQCVHPILCTLPKS